jgi:hypothetical protein
MRGKKGGGDKPITKDQAEKMLMEINSLMAKTKQTLQNMIDDGTYRRFLEMDASNILTKLGKEVVSEKNILETWIKFNDNPVARVKNPIVEIRGFSWLDSVMNKINTILQLEEELRSELAWEEFNSRSVSTQPRRRLFDSDSGVSSVSSVSSDSTVLPSWYNSDETYYGSDEDSDGEVRRTLSFGGKRGNKSRRKKSRSMTKKKSRKKKSMTKKKSRKKKSMTKKKKNKRKTKRKSRK